MTDVLIGVNNELEPEIREKCTYIAYQLLRPEGIDNIYPDDTILPKHSYTQPKYEVSIFSTVEKRLAHTFDPEILPGTLKRLKSLDEVDKIIVLGKASYKSKFENSADAYIPLIKGWEKKLINTLDNMF